MRGGSTSASSSPLSPPPPPRPHSIPYPLNRPPTYDAKHPFMAKVSASRELFSPDAREESTGDLRHCTHLEVDLTGSGIRYYAGDHLAVWACQPERLVNAYARILGLTDSPDTLDRVIQVNWKDPSTHAQRPPPFPNPTTYRIALSHYLDLQSCPSRSTIGTLVNRISKEGVFHGREEAGPSWVRTREVLQAIGDDRSKYEISVVIPHMTLAGLLDQVAADTNEPTLPLSFSLLLELQGRSQVRYYSISSSPKVTSSTAASSSVHITAVLVRESLATGDSNRFQGLATTFLRHLHRQSLPSSDQDDPQDPFIHSCAPPLSLPVYVRPSNFRLPRDRTRPVVMVGPGTGVAPFRGFIQERAWMARQPTSPDQGKVGPTILFYGCRKADQDFLYQDEWASYSNPDSPTALPGFQIITAFSRETPGQKIYVQQRLREWSDQVWDWIHIQSGSFYLCGDGKRMAKDVLETLLSLAADRLGSKEKADAWFKDLKGQNRYLEDTW